MLSGLGARITVVLCILLSASVALVATLSLSKYRETLGRVVEARFRHVVDDVARTATLGLDLQLPLAELTGLQGALDRARAEHDDLRYVEIFDAEGRILFSTDPTTVGDILPDAWIYQNLGTGQDLWRRRDERDLVLGLPVRTRFDQVVGGVTLAYTEDPIERGVAGMRGHLLKIAAVVVPGFTLALTAVLWLLFRGSRRRLRALAEWLEGAPAAPEPRNLGGLAKEAGRGTLAAFAAVADARAELRRLGTSPP